MQDEILATSEGLLRCLQALAEETASLGLTRTYLALQHAISVGRAESGVLQTATASAYAGLIH